ncbi:MAG TPA: PcfJ domain-containing protein [Polyangiaceae bacterium]|nr:PcfJ domain-containing protein [Polyangiaceae bacterium]
MAKQALTTRRRDESVTTLIIQGGWKGRRYPGNARFQANCRALAGSYGGKTQRARHLPAIALFAAVERESEILDMLCSHRDKIVALLLRIAAYSARWVRPVEQWRPQTTEAARQLGELVRHLFERYPTPRFFESAWRRQQASRVDWAAFDWYVHVAGGENIRTVPGLPVALSKRAAHELTVAPAELSPRRALRWAQLSALGARPRLARALLLRTHNVDLDCDPLWVPLIGKLATEPDFDLNQIGPLVDYLAHRLRESGEAFSLKGRSVGSLVAGMQRWHRDLALERYARAYAQVMPGGAGSRWIALANASGLSEERGDETWELAELRSFEELYDEGRRQHHCVASYVGSCVSGWTSIWSLRILRFGSETRRVTIRVDVSRRAVVEARTLANAAIRSGELGFVRRWAEKSRLGVDAIATHD